MDGPIGWRILVSSLIFWHQFISPQFLGFTFGFKPFLKSHLNFFLYSKKPAIFFKDQIEFWCCRGLKRCKKEWKNVWLICCYSTRFEQSWKNCKNQYLCCRIFIWITPIIPIQISCELFCFDTLAIPWLGLPNLDNI